MIRNSPLSQRTLALLAALALALALAPSSALAAHPSSRSGGTGGVRACLKAIAGGDTSAATAVSAATPPSLASAFSVFDRPAGAQDTFTAEPSLADVLSGSGVSRYDAGGLRLLDSDASGDDIFIVGVTLRAPSVPAACAHVPALKDYPAVIALQKATTGSGPGVCTVSTAAVSEDGRSESEVDEVSCESLQRLGSYYGAIGLSGLLESPDSDGDSGASGPVVADGVSSVQETFSGGRQVTATVSSNLAATPDSSPVVVTKSLSPTRELEDVLPTAITERGSTGQVLATYTRPANAIRLYLAADQFDQELNTALGGGGTNVTASGGGTSPTIKAKCTAAGACTAIFITKKCGAKTCQVTTTTTVCSTRHVCHSSATTKSEPKSKADRPGGGSVSSTSGDLRRAAGSPAVARRSSAPWNGSPLPWNGSLLPWNGSPVPRNGSPLRWNGSRRFSGPADAARRP